MSCVGLKNHRYFVLFLFYLTLGCTFLTVSGYSKFNTRPKNSYAHICFILAAVFSVVLFLFTIWHLFLVGIGMTTIEIFGFYGSGDMAQKYNFSRGNWRKNFETVFGTSSLVRIVLPSLRSLNYDGVYWPDTLHSV
jgi:palmitoyltransferase